MLERHQMTLGFGNGGWVCWRASSWPVVAYLRYDDVEDRLVAVEMYVERIDGERIDTNTLRDLPLGTIDEMVNADPTRVRSRLGTPGPDLRRAARNYATTWGHADHWVAQMTWAQVPGSDVPQAPMPRVKKIAPVEVPPAERIARLDVPDAKPYGDDFYESVAEAHRMLRLVGAHPAEALADANGVPKTTANRWIKVARQRGHLEPGRPGRGG